MNKITSTVTYGNNAKYDTLDQWQRDANPWTVELRYQGRRMTVHYWTGTGISGEPDTACVLESLISDASSADQRFENWAADYGYDTDSRRAHHSWQQVQAQTAKLRRLLGANYERIIGDDHSTFRAYVGSSRG